MIDRNLNQIQACNGQIKTMISEGNRSLQSAVMSFPVQFGCGWTDGGSGEDTGGQE